MYKVLISAYACSPNWGSEPGMGWNWVINLARYCKVHLITNCEFRNEIERTLFEHELRENIKVYYNDIGERATRMGQNQGDWRFYFYYRKWQKATLKIAHKIIATNEIDIVHQLNMIGFREPGFLWKIADKPFVWGPIGGMVNFPFAYLRNSNTKVKLFFVLKQLINYFQFNFSPRIKKAIKRADILISAVQNTQLALHKFHNVDSFLINETGCNLKKKNILYSRFNDLSLFNILWVGKFDIRKQLGLALSTVSKVKDLHGLKFHIIGTGTKKQISYYKKLCLDLELTQHIVWHNKQPNSQVQEIMRKSHLFFFSSLFEGTPHVIIEAIQNQLPILCFNICGHGQCVTESIGQKIELSVPEQSVNEFAEIIRYLYFNRDILKKQSINCIKRSKQLSWVNKAELMISLYDEAIIRFSNNR